MQLTYDSTKTHFPGDESLVKDADRRKLKGAAPGIELGTSPTLRENHTTRLSGRLYTDREDRFTSALRGSQILKDNVSPVYYQGNSTLLDNTGDMIRRLPLFSFSRLTRFSAGLLTTLASDGRSSYRRISVIASPGWITVIVFYLRPPRRQDSSLSAPSNYSTVRVLQSRD